MAIKYLGERISPSSKFSVQYGVAYENNVPIANSEKAKKILEKYKHAVENNWIVTIDVIRGDGNNEKLNDSSLVRRMYISVRSSCITHYLSRPSTFSLPKQDSSKNHLPPFCISYYHEFVLKFSKKQAEKIKKLFLGKGVKKIFTIEYYPGLTGEHLGYNILPSNSIETRFSLMDFD